MPILAMIFSKPLINRIAVARYASVKVQSSRSALDPVRQRILRQIGVHNSRTTADQNGKVMRIDTFSRAHVERSRTSATLCGSDANAQQRSQGSSASAHGLAAELIGQHDVPAPERTASSASAEYVPDRVQGIAPRSKVQSIVDKVRVEFASAHPIAHCRQTGCPAPEFRSALILIQHVLKIPETRLQAHHTEFAQADRSAGSSPERKFWRKKWLSGRYFWTEPPMAYHHPSTPASLCHPRP